MQDMLKMEIKQNKFSCPLVDFCILVGETEYIILISK